MEFTHQVFGVQSLPHKSLIYHNSSLHPNIRYIDVMLSMQYEDT